MTTFPDQVFQFGGVPVGALAVGNVYYVIKKSEAFYDVFLEARQGTYPDGSLRVHPDDGDGLGIQAALDACVANRNDYVIVQPSQDDYDLTVALTMSKKAVHLLCPAGFSYAIGANNASRLHQTGSAPVIEVSGSAVEIAGFYFKNKAVEGGIIISNTTYGLNIHNNFWAMSLSTSTNEPMIGPLLSNSGDAGAWSTIERNFIQSTNGTSATIAAIIRFNSDATGVRVINNHIGIGDGNNTATVGILNYAVKGMTNDNDFFAYQTASGAGVFTHCVQIHASGVAYGNRGNVADSELIVGGTAGLSFIQNYNSVSGGTQDTEA